MTSPAMLPLPSGGVLVASPSLSLREQIRRSVWDGSCLVEEVSGGADALVKLESGDWQVLFLDRRLPDLDAEEVIQIIKVRFPGIEVVLLDSNATKGWIPPRPGKGNSWAQGRKEIGEENGLEGSWRGAVAERDPIQPLPGMIGSSVVMQRLYRMTRLVASRPTTVLVTGATGTGKELVARALHQLSPRSAGPFVVVNCAAIPESLLESELFGFARGAFTGAVQAYAGKIHAAQGGTLFLDEIGDLPLSLQAKLLRFLEQKEVQRLGSSESLRVDVRVVAATNANLSQQVEEGKFREDLYYRLSAFPLEIPPLRDRREDIAALAGHFLQQIAAASHTSIKLSPGAARRLEAHGWSGNVRELQQVVERASILAEGGREILTEHLYFSSPTRTLPVAAKSAAWRSE